MLVHVRLLKIIMAKDHFMTPKNINGNTYSGWEWVLEISEHLWRFFQGRPRLGECGGPNDALPDVHSTCCQGTPGRCHEGNRRRLATRGRLLRCIVSGDSRGLRPCWAEGGQVQGGGLGWGQSIRDRAEVGGGGGQQGAIPPPAGERRCTPHECEATFM